MSEHAAFTALQNHLSNRIIGQEGLIERLLLALLSDGHLLVEGAPGLAKTRAIKELASGLEGEFHRVQFTPDLLPSDLVGTDIYRPQDGSFHFQPGPLFNNILLADEVNRAPAKVQSALLEAMAERQITVGRTSHPLPPLFMVMATQNPIEQEGTYPLPEAQLDRFVMHVLVDYPDETAEREIVRLIREEERTPGRDLSQTQTPKLSSEAVLTARRQVLEIYMSAALEEYLVRLVRATRTPAPYGSDLENWVRYGASPRAALALDRVARARAWLQGREFVTPDDIHTIVPDVLRHRILLSYEAEADGITPDTFIKELIQRVATP
ncbi:MAG: AAA family ATPase [Magnetococcales bacterium]|nr:AAA family ATPase [Magnetococcales bacterium]